MSTPQIPEWDLADRMRKALRVSGVGVQEIADYLGVGRNTVSTWINGKIRPNRQTQRLWALRCGVSFDWLTTGNAPTIPSGRPESAGNMDVTSHESRHRPGGRHIAGRRKRRLQLLTPTGAARLAPVTCGM